MSRHSGFLLNVATLLGGKAGAALLTFGFMPLVSRLYAPSDFGVAALFISIVTILGGVIALRYERAVVLPKSKVEAGGLVRLALHLTLGLAAGAWLILVPMYLIGLPLPFAARLGVWVWVVPLGVAAFGLIAVAEAWLLRNKRFQVMAVADVSQAALTGGGRLGAGVLYGSSVWGLIVGYLLGLCFKFLLLSRAIRPALRAAAEADKLSRPGVLARRYRDFPLYNAPAAFVMALSNNLPILMLGYMFAPAVVGLYAMAQRVVQMPVHVAGSSFRRVYLQRTAEIHNSRRPLQGALTKSTLGLLAVGSLPFGALGLFGEPLVTWFLGAEWREAGRYVEILVPWVYAIWISVPASALMVILRRQALWLRIQIGVTVVRLATFLGAWLLEASATTTLVAFAAVGVVIQVGVIASAFRLVRNVARVTNAQSAQ